MRPTGEGEEWGLAGCCSARACLSDRRAEGWTGFLTDDGDGLEPTGVAVFCPSCASTQFGWLPRRPKWDELRGEESVD